MSYKFRETFTGEDGIRHDVRANSKKELLEKMARVKKEIEEGYTPLRSSSVTVNRWLDTCLSQYKSNVTEQTLTGYKSKAKRWIRPIIGHLKVKDVKPLN